MGSVENSPVWLALIQFLVVLGNAVVYVRFKHRGDVEKRDLGDFKLSLEAIRLVADAAKISADLANGDKYESVRLRCDDLASSLKGCQGDNAILRESVQSLSNKLASREKIERHAAKREADEEAAREAGNGEVPMTAEQLQAMGAIRLPMQPAPLSARTVPPGFGRMGR